MNPCVWVEEQVAAWGGIKAQFGISFPFGDAVVLVTLDFMALWISQHPVHDGQLR